MSLGSHGVIKVTKKLLKMADKEPSDIDEVFTKILCGRKFCVWKVTKLKFTELLLMASLGL